MALLMPEGAHNSAMLAPATLLLLVGPTGSINAGVADVGH